MSKARGLADLGNVYNDGALSNRNLIINGAMQVAQRGVQTTGVVSNGFYTCDRFEIRATTLGTWTMDQSTDAPSGFAASIKATCTTADAAPAAAGWVQLFYEVEARDLQAAAYGTADAKTLTLSFWVKSNKTGGATLTLMQEDAGYRLASPQYTINSANTWEYKTITVIGDPSGVINNDSGSGLQIEFWMNAGTNYTTGSHQNTWSTYSQVNRSPSNLGVGGAISDYFQITGVQLEVGDTATPFEHRSYGDELARCQRYCCAFGYGEGDVISSRLYSSRYATGGAMVIADFPVTMRATPTLTYSLGGNGAVDSDYSNKNRIQLSDGSDTDWRIYNVLAEAEL